MIQTAVTLKYPKEVILKGSSSFMRGPRNAKLLKMNGSNSATINYLGEDMDVDTKLVYSDKGTSLLSISRNREKAGLSNEGPISELNSTIVDAYKKTNSKGKVFDVKEHVRKLPSKGDTVKVKKEYGGGSGRVSGFSDDNKYVFLERKNGQGEIHHISNLL